jgi:hypothetical protein
MVVKDYPLSFMLCKISAQITAISSLTDRQSPKMHYID